jgi:hypothetical protein
MGLSMTQLQTYAVCACGEEQNAIIEPPRAFSSLTILIAKDGGYQPSFQSEIV